MLRSVSWTATAVLASAFLLAAPSLGFAQGATSARALVAAPIDDGQLVTLEGNTRPEANADNDRGAVAPNFALDGMLLQLQRAPEDERVVDRFIDQLQDRNSPLYHHWLTATEYGQRFGLAQSDIGRIVSWLSGHGFTVNRIYPNRMVIDFSGTAGEVAATFHTQIHRLDVEGVAHIANMSDPKIPAALAPAVAGVVSLHDFRPHNKRRPPLTYPGGTYAVAPGDLETIYNFNAAFKEGWTGTGITIAVAEDTNLYDNNKDWYTFRSVFGLTKNYPSGTISLVHPGSCTNPGTEGDNAGDESEAALDAQWASAAAPNAEILFASCEGTNTTSGVEQAIQNLVNTKDTATPPPIISVSYGVCETENGAASNKSFLTVYQTAAAAGVSVFVATGDNNATDCAGDGQKGANVGIGVNGWASTVYNVAVGGTDFLDTYQGTNAKYWGPNKGAPYSTALSYIPEQPWNDTCASTLLALYTTGSALTYGPNGFCNKAGAGGIQDRTLGGGEGGPSGCATGKPATYGVVGGTCAGYAKPTWQKGLYGNPADGVRDVPDVAMFAAVGTWNHYLISCFSDPQQQGTPCTGNPTNWAGNGGGTSFATPIVAGIQALVNESQGLTTAGVGNPAPIYYQLAATEYASATSAAACNSSKGTAIGANCVFNDVTQGDDTADCVAYNKSHPNLFINCYRDGEAVGVLSTSNTAYQPAYKATPGYDFPTGIGTINVHNLIVNWPGPL
jgi:subtilase family serine protease